MSKLVIVESPAKARTIEKYLPDDFVVRASMGHVRDLPDNAGQLPKKFRKESWASLGVNVENGFEAHYVEKEGRSKKSLSELRSLLKEADELYLATDEDREGEAISWHLLEALKPKVPVKRMVFHEITKSAITAALENTREVDENLVEAQEARRILDRLVGYPLSLLVAKKIKYGLSAGRVQSPAVRLIVERERERRRFKIGSYWDLKATLDKDKQTFDANLVAVDGTRLASGKDFDETTGKVEEGKDVLLLGEKEAKELVEKLKGKPLTVADINERSYTSNPRAPFTTSTLQQEASRKLGMGASDTMSVAQRLYENGFITYMRTDSMNLSGQAINAARAAVKSLYGEDYLSERPRNFSTKSKGAQEAHEAIRPTGDNFTHPDKTGLKGREYKLYDLIWKRTVACQMAEARKTSIRYDLQVEVDGKKLDFRANGTRIDFPGFLRAYVEGSDDPEASLEDKEVLLPKVDKGDDVKCKKVEPIGHETKPPARYTEASLVKKLEEEGIGRPSTYATIINKITDGRYGRKEGRSIVPTFTAFAVADFFTNYFPDLVDLKFTARMEDELDQIAAGKETKTDYLHEFYRKEGAFADKVEQGDEKIVPDDVKVVDLEELDGFVLKVGPYGPYAQMTSDEDRKVNVPEEIAPADLTEAQLKELLEAREAGPEVLGTHPDTGDNIYLMNGRYGHYLQLGDREKGSKKKPKTGSLMKDMQPEDVTLEIAVQLLSLPRELGKHPEDGKKIEAGIGRYGAFIRHNKDYRNLDSEDQVFTVTLDDALKKLAEPKGRRRSSQKVLKDLGEHEGETVQILDGRYGPYVKMGKTNASLPKGTKPEDVDMKKALELVEERKAKKGKKKSGKKKGGKKTKKK
jgi:DNA topoisomerase-1